MGTQVVRMHIYIYMCVCTHPHSGNCSRQSFHNFYMGVSENEGARNPPANAKTSKSGIRIFGEASDWPVF